MKPKYIAILGTGGLIVRRNFWTASKPPKEKRGKVVGVSGESRARLARFLCTHTVPDLPVWALSLTVRHVATPEEWRKVVNLFNTTRSVKDLPWVWRVELQKRGAPHMHLILWGLEQDCERVRDAWLRAWGLEDNDSIRRACHWTEQRDFGWFNYLACHHIKSGQDSHGWHGRSWGVHQREQFEYIDLGRLELSIDQYRYFRRLLNRVLRGRGARKDLPNWAPYTRLGADPGLCRELCRRAKRKIAL